MFPVKKAAASEEVITLETLTAGSKPTVTNVVASPDDRNTSVALPCSTIKLSRIRRPAGRVDSVKAFKLEDARVKYAVNSDILKEKE